MVGRLDGKVAVITGAGQGIGRATTRAFVGEGARVWAVDRNPQTMATLQAEHPSVEIGVLDVTDATAIKQFAAGVSSVDVLFNCAGWVPVGGIAECAEADWDAAMDINAKSMFLMIQALLPRFGAGGSIINMASVVSSIGGVSDRLAYSASKAAVIGLTKAAAADLMSRGIRCNAIAPGTVDSPSLAERLAADGDPEAARARFVARQPMGRIGTTDEIAALAVYLASDESAYTTGSVYVIDGGMTL